MQRFLSHSRFLLENLSLPFLALAIFHFGGEALVELFPFPLPFMPQALLPYFLGGLFLLFTLWSWNFTPLKNITPCHHPHTLFFSSMHLLASVLLVLHFFPEHLFYLQLFQHTRSFWENTTLLGLFFHTLTDFLLMIFLSSYWPKRWQQWFSFLSFLWVWVLSFFLSYNLLPKSFFLHEPLYALLGSWILGMFLHLPHKHISCKKKKPSKAKAS